jgi:tetratricopeptide (TPR) repeat protein
VVAFYFNKGYRIQKNPGLRKARPIFHFNYFILGKYSTLAGVHFTMALMNFAGMWDWEGSESEIKKAIAINPNHAEAHGMYSHLLNILGRPEEAMEQIKLALRLNRNNATIKVWYSQDLLFIRRYEDVI